MSKEKLTAFILTHGRPKKVVTYKTLKKAGFTGDIYIVVDNEDKTIEEYRKIYKEKVIVFDKLKVSKTFDTADNFEDRRAIVYARNVCFKIAKKLGLKYFIELDDDYTNFLSVSFTDDSCDRKLITNLDAVFDIMLDFYEENPSLLSLATSQGGDFIGGEIENKLKRKCMNTFICDTDREFTFLGRVNEDVNTYCNLGSRGNLFFTIPQVQMNQLQTQSNSGGMTELYLSSGTYIKSFYTVMYNPSSVKISFLNKRIHHRINWNNTVPNILREEIKKQI